MYKVTVENGQYVVTDFSSGSRLVTQGTTPRDWEKVEMISRHIAGHPTAVERMVDRLQQIAESGDINQDGSVAALAYATLVEEGYE